MVIPASLESLDPPVPLDLKDSKDKSGHKDLKDQL